MTIRDDMFIKWAFRVTAFSVKVGYAEAPERTIGVFCTHRQDRLANSYCRLPLGGCAEAACAVHDTAEKAWRHLDFFEH